MKGLRALLCGLLLLVPCAPAYADTVTILASQDTHIRSTNPTVASGWHRSAQVGYSSSEGIQRMLVQFDLGGVSCDATIQSARFEMYYTLASLGSPGMELTIHRLTQDWDEDTACWETMGAASSPTVYASQRVGGYGDALRWVSWDVSDLARLWQAQPEEDHGLAVQGQEWPPDNYVYFHTKEKGAEWAPRLIVEYTGALCTPTPRPTVMPTPTKQPTIPAVERSLHLPLILRHY